MTGTFYSGFTKRRNSTLQPTGGTSSTFVLKEGCSIEKPVLLLKSNDFTINYVSAFGHYYFVDDIKSIRDNLIEVYCSMDVLATYKTEIGSYSALVERSDSFYDASYPDPAVAMLNEFDFDYIAADPSLYNSTGCFIVSVLNNIGSGTGFTCQYAMNSFNLELLARYVNTDWGSAATDVLSWLQATFLKTASCIIDCIWIPISFSSISGSSETVKIGVDQVVVGGTPVTGTRLTGPTSVTAQAVLAALPHYYSAGDFRRCAPYSLGKIFIPGYGVADFNPADFEPSGNMYITTVIDISTGDTVVYLTNADACIVSSYSFNIGVSCPVGHVGANVTETLGGIINTAGNFAMYNAMKNPVGKISADYAGASSLVNTMVSALGATASYSGRKGGRAVWLTNKTYQVCIFAHLTQAINSMEEYSGRPCMEVKQLSTCSGFVKCINAAVPIAGMSTEKDEVNNFLNAGFYYE